MNWKRIGSIFSDIGDIVAQIGYWIVVGFGVITVISVVVFIVFWWVKYVFEPVFQWAGLA